MIEERIIESFYKYTFWIDFGIITWPDHIQRQIQKLLEVYMILTFTSITFIILLKIRRAFLISILLKSIVSAHKEWRLILIFSHLHLRIFRALLNFIIFPKVINIFAQLNFQCFVNNIYLLWNSCGELNFSENLYCLIIRLLPLYFIDFFDYDVFIWIMIRSYLVYHYYLLFSILYI